MSMKKITSWQNLLLVFLIIAIIAGGAYCFILLNEKERAADIDLYTLVPNDSFAIVETDNAGLLINCLDNAAYTEKIADLHISKLLESFKNNLQSISDSKAHGFSKQMNRMLLSFHQPNNARNQILYCQLKNGDEKFIEEYIKQNTSEQYPPKRFNYRNEEIIIYPVNATEFLACYYQPEFLAISFEKQLIEKVIDTYLDETSILNDEYFSSIVKRNKINMEATIYQKGKKLQIGEENADVKIQRVAHWVELNIKLNPDVIYLSGTCFDPDTCRSLNNAIKQQEPTEILSGKKIPSNTYLVTQASITNVRPILTTFIGETCLTDRSSTDRQHNDSCFYQFMQSQAGSSISILMFGDTEKIENQHAIAMLQLKNPSEAGMELKQQINAMNFKQTYPKGIHVHQYYPVLAMPNIQILENFTTLTSEYYYTCFYDDMLLIAADTESIKQYLQMIDEGKVKEGEPLFDECHSHLASESNLLLIARMDRLVTMPSIYRQVMPSFFYQHMEFFQHFVLIAQFTESDDIIYPTFIMKYLNE